MFRKKRGALKVLILVLIGLCGFFYFGCMAADYKDADKELYKQIELFSDALTIVQSDYVKDVEPKNLVYGALGGMLSSLDGYSQFMDPDSFKELEVETKGEFGGLGIEIGMRESVLTVIAPLHGTPAEKAGLKSGDRIVRIEGESTQGLSLTDAVKKLRGKPKTKVKLTILREDEERLKDYTITRDIIKLKSIEKASLLEDGIAYIKLVEFQENSPKELEERLIELKKKGMKALILDLRNNPGGLLEVANGVSGKLLKKGDLIVTLKGRAEKQNRVYKAKPKKDFSDFPLVVMINKGSASASEIVAGAIQDNKRGIILGTKSFGKGSVQTVIPLKDGSAVRLTTAAYYTPSGASITDKGITPDVEVKLIEREEEKKEKNIFDELDEKKKLPKPEAKKEDRVEYDNQLRTAVDLLKGILIYNK